MDTGAAISLRPCFHLTDRVLESDLAGLNQPRRFVCLGMILSENRFPRFEIMRLDRAGATGARA
jgi:hypothetical protein